MDNSPFLNQAPCSFFPLFFFSLYIHKPNQKSNRLLSSSQCIFYIVSFILTSEEEYCMHEIGEPFRPYNNDHTDHKDHKDHKEGGSRFSKEFALIIVLFILLIIIGATWCGGFGGQSCAPVYGYGYGPYYC